MKYFLTIVCVLASVASFGQKHKGMKFDIEDFNKKFEVAEWLFRYDAVAWWTTDSVMTSDQEEIKRIGTEWFCFQDSSELWHAIYGKYDQGVYDQVFHYTVESKANVIRVQEQIDTSVLNAYARALITANHQLDVLRDSIYLGFNQYIKQNDDHTFTVWILPAFQRNGTAIYGGEFIYTIDRSGRNVLKDDSYFRGSFRGFKVGEPVEIWLDYSGIDKPSLGGIFFVWYYKSYFSKIVINTKKSTSTVFQHEDKTYYWVHVEKDK